MTRKEHSLTELTETSLATAPLLEQRPNEPEANRLKVLTRNVSEPQASLTKRKQQNIMYWGNNNSCVFPFSQIRKAYNIAISKYPDPERTTDEDNLFELDSAYKANAKTLCMLFRLLYKAFCRGRGTPIPLNTKSPGEHNYPVSTLFRFNSFLRGGKTKFFAQDLMRVCAMCHSNDRESFTLILQALRKTNILDVREPDLDLFIRSTKNTPDQRIFVLLPFGYKFLTVLFTEALNNKSYYKRIILSALEVKALKSVSEQIGSEQKPIPITKVIKRIMTDKETQQIYNRTINTLRYEEYEDLEK